MPDRSDTLTLPSNHIEQPKVWDLKLTEREMVLVCRWIFGTGFKGRQVKDAAGIMAIMAECRPIRRSCCLAGS